MRVGTGAFPSMALVNSEPSFTMAYGSTAWTAQFYLLVTPRFENIDGIIEENVLKFQNPPSLITLTYFGVQKFDSGLSYLELSLYYVTTGTFLYSNNLVVPYGEWLLITISAQAATQTYTLKV